MPETQETQETQYLKFRTWMLQPGAFPTKPPVDGMAGMQAMLEDALWTAWQAGYQEGVQRPPERE